MKIVVDTRVEFYININSNFNFENILNSKNLKKSDVDLNIKIWIDAWDLINIHTVGL